MKVETIVGELSLPDVAKLPRSERVGRLAEAIAGIVTVVIADLLDACSGCLTDEEDVSVGEAVMIALEGAAKGRGGWLARHRS